MEIVKITIEKDRNDIIIKSSEGQQITILDSNKELKATEIIEFLDYTKEKTYSIDNLRDELLKDKNIVSIHTIFKEIIEKLNPVNAELGNIF